MVVVVVVVVDVDDCQMLQGSVLLTIIYRRQVDGFGPDRAQSRWHLQPQLVAVHPERLDGAAFLPGLNRRASKPHLPDFLTHSLPLLHYITWQVSPPRMKTNTKK